MMIEQTSDCVNCRLDRFLMTSLVQVIRVKPSEMTTESSRETFKATTFISVFVVSPRNRKFRT